MVAAKFCFLAIIGLVGVKAFILKLPTVLRTLPIRRPKPVRGRFDTWEACKGPTRYTPRPQPNQQQQQQQEQGSGHEEQKAKAEQKEARLPTFPRRRSRNQGGWGPQPNSFDNWGSCMANSPRGPLFPRSNRPQPGSMHDNSRLRSVGEGFTLTSAASRTQHRQAALQQWNGPNSVNNRSAEKKSRKEANFSRDPKEMARSIGRSGLTQGNVDKPRSATSDDGILTGSAVDDSSIPETPTKSPELHRSKPINAFFDFWETMDTSKPRARRGRQSKSIHAFLEHWGVKPPSNSRIQPNALKTPVELKSHQDESVQRAKVVEAPMSPKIEPKNESNQQPRLPVERFGRLGSQRYSQVRGERREGIRTSEVSGPKSNARPSQHPQQASLGSMGDLGSTLDRRRKVQIESPIPRENLAGNPTSSQRPERGPRSDRSKPISAFLDQCHTIDIQTRRTKPNRPSQPNREFHGSKPNFRQGSALASGSTMAARNQPHSFKAQPNNQSYPSRRPPGHTKTNLDDDNNMGAATVQEDSGRIPPRGETARSPYKPTIDGSTFHPYNDVAPDWLRKEIEEMGGLKDELQHQNLNPETMASKENRDRNQEVTSGSLHPPVQSKEETVVGNVFSGRSGGSLFNEEVNPVELIGVSEQDDEKALDVSESIAPTNPTKEERVAVDNSLEALEKEIEGVLALAEAAWEKADEGRTSFDLKNQSGTLKEPIHEEIVLSSKEIEAVLKFKQQPWKKGNNKEGQVDHSNLSQEGKMDTSVLDSLGLELGTKEKSIGIDQVNASDSTAGGAFGGAGEVWVETDKPRLEKQTKEKKEPVNTLEREVKDALELAEKALKEADEGETNTRTLASVEEESKEKQKSTVFDQTNSSANKAGDVLEVAGKELGMTSEGQIETDSLVLKSQTDKHENATNGLDKEAGDVLKLAEDAWKDADEGRMDSETLASLNRKSRKKEKPAADAAEEMNALDKEVEDVLKLAESAWKEADEGRMGAEMLATFKKQPTSSNKNPLRVLGEAIWKQNKTNDVLDKKIEATLKVAENTSKVAGEGQMNATTLVTSKIEATKEAELASALEKEVADALKLAEDAWKEADRGRMDAKTLASLKKKSKKQEKVPIAPKQEVQNTSKLAGRVLNGTNKKRMDTSKVVPAKTQATIPTKNPLQMLGENIWNHWMTNTGVKKETEEAMERSEKPPYKDDKLTLSKTESKPKQKSAAVDQTSPLMEVDEERMDTETPAVWKNQSKKQEEAVNNATKEVDGAMKHTKSFPQEEVDGRDVEAGILVSSKKMETKKKDSFVVAADTTALEKEIEDALKLAEDAWREADKGRIDVDTLASLKKRKAEKKKEVVVAGGAKILGKELHDAPKRGVITQEGTGDAKTLASLKEPEIKETETVSDCDDPDGAKALDKEIEDALRLAESAWKEADEGRMDAETLASLMKQPKKSTNPLKVLGEAIWKSGLKNN